MKPTRESETSGGLDEARRTLVREALRDPVWRGVERGMYELRLVLPGAGSSVEIGVGVRVKVRLDEAVLLRQIDRLLQRVVDENLEALKAAAGSDEPRKLLSAAWAALEPVRCVGYTDGSYQVTPNQGRAAVTYYVTEWDSILLRRHDELLDRVYAEHRAVFGGACAEPTASSPTPLDTSIPEAA